jgi:hypothetical protein
MRFEKSVVKCDANVGNPGDEIDEVHKFDRAIRFMRRNGNR